MVCMGHTKIRRRSLTIVPQGEKKEKERITWVLEMAKGYYVEY
jgi:hypothetical protein